MLTVYTLDNCDTCRKATRWLRESGIEHAEKAIRETPPTLPQLKAVLAAYDGDLGKLFNSAGREFREMGLKESLSGMAEKDALELLASNGRLVKRPFLVGDGVGLVGFNATVWSNTLKERL